MSRLWFAAALVALAVFMVVQAWGFNIHARRLPLVVGLPLVVLALLNLAGELRAWRRASRPAAADGPVEDAATPGAPWTDEAAERAGVGAPIDQGAGRVNVTKLIEAREKELEEPPERSWWAAIGVLALVVVLYRVFGQILSAPIIVAGLMRLLGRESWRNIAISVVFITGTLYVLINFLGVQAYPGMLPRWFGWW